MGKAETPSSFLDRPAARWLAALVIVLCVALLSFLHRDDLRRFRGADDPSAQERAADDPAAPCIAQRFAEIDGMVADGVVNERQAAAFKQRAEAMCQSTEGGGSGPPIPSPLD